jgi:two-component system, NtrC family, sensor kinase
MRVTRDETPQGQSLLAGRARYALGTRAPRALIIDDEPTMAKGIGRVISGLCEVEIASTAREGLRLLLETKDQEYGVILCDWLLPDLGGDEVYAEVARSKPHLARRFVLVTGGAFSPEARRFLEATEVRCLEKPFELDQLLGFVSEILERG